MLSISFGTRTHSAHDPLVKKAIEIGMEFMDLTGKPHMRYYSIIYSDITYDRGMVERD